jgi:hypothetical protein
MREKIHFIAFTHVCMPILCVYGRRPMPEHGLIASIWTVEDSNSRKAAHSRLELHGPIPTRKLAVRNTL